MKEHIKNKCSFGVMNLLNMNTVEKTQKFDVIFCRNVFIYFEPVMVDSISSELKGFLYDHGFLISGLSEALDAREIGLKNEGPSIYSIPGGQPEREMTSSKSFEPIQEKPLRVLVVDDSPSVSKLLSRIFDADPNFELAGVATNGLEAAEFLKHQSADVMTLDIHMPEMDGVEYLKKHYSEKHPKVVVVSSASREDFRYAQQVLDYGASDFVEKPAMNNLKERAEEIKIKLKMAVKNTSTPAPRVLDKAFARNYSIESTNEKARVFFATYSDQEKLGHIIQSFEGDQPPTVIVFEGCENFFPVIKDSISRFGTTELYQPGMTLSPGNLYIADFSEHISGLASEFASRSVSLSVLGIASSKVYTALTNLKQHQILVEDLEDQNPSLLEIANDCFPWTSLEHVGTEYLASTKK